MTISAVTGLSVTNITTNSADVSWIGSTGAVQYDVYLNSSFLISVTTTSTSLLRLSAGTTYTVTVYAEDSSGGTSSGASQSFTTVSNTQPPSAVTGLSKTSSTTTSISIGWTSSSGATGYDVYKNGSKDGSTTGTSYTLSGLTAGTSYSITVYATNSAGSSSGTSITASTDSPPQPPPAVTGLSVSSITQTSATASWNSSSGATSYDVYKGGSFVANTSSTSYSFSGLSSGTTYSITVYAKNSNGSSSGTSTSFTTSSPSPPPAVTGLSASSISSSSATITWNYSSGATSYDVYKNGSFVANTTGTGYSLTGLSPSTTYTVTVYAKNTGGSSSGTSTSFTTSIAPPPAVTGLGLSTPPTQTSLSPQWNASSGATSYDVYNDGSLYANTTNTSITISGLVANTSYNITIYAKNSAGSSSGTSQTFTTAINVPPAVTGLSASSITTSGATVSWNASSGATSYDVYKDGSLYVNTTNTSWSFTGLTAGTTYNITVYAKNSGGSSSGTSISLLTIPNSVSGLSASSVSQSSATISWTSSTGATFYKIYKNSNYVTDVTSTSYSATGLNASTSYTFDVYAGNSSGVSSGSSTTFTTPSPPQTSGQIEIVSTGDTTIVARIKNLEFGSGYTTLSITVNGVTKSVTINGQDATGTYWISNTADFQGLTPSTTYTVTANITYPNQTSSISSTNVTTLAPIDRPPQVIIQSIDGVNNISVTWSATDDYGLNSTNTYELYITGANNNTFGNKVYITNTAQNTNLSYTFTYDGTMSAFVIGATYQVKVIGYDTKGQSDSSTSSVVYSKSRPPNFAWTNPKTAGGDFNLTADEWNALISRVGDFREYKSYPRGNYTTAVKGNTFYATMFNEVRDAIATISASVPPAQGKDKVIKADDLNQLVTALNSVPSN